MALLDFIKTGINKIFRPTREIQEEQKFITPEQSKSLPGLINLGGRLPKWLKKETTELKDVRPRFEDQYLKERRELVGEQDIGKIVDNIKWNETRGEEDPYSFKRFSGSKIQGDALGAYQVTEGELKDNNIKYLGRKVTSEEFLNNSQDQDNYIINKIQDQLDKGFSENQVYTFHRYGINTKQDPDDNPYVRSIQKRLDELTLR